MVKQVYQFHEGNANMRNLLGGKGANLAEMSRLDLPVPQGFTITTEACINYLNDDRELSEELLDEITSAIKEFEEITGKGFSRDEDLLLVSVRSGARISMPGMMDTILNLGLNDHNVKTLAEHTGNEWFALDCYRRLLSMFGDVVFGIGMHHFEDYLAQYKRSKGVTDDQDLSVDDLKAIIEHYKEIYKENGHEFPQDPREQLNLAVEAVFDSWDNERAHHYRDLNDIPHDLGTAVNIQEMVYGNSGDESGTGVVFSRNPATGEPGLFGEFLINAQGEDVVAGIRTPQPISEMEKVMPEAYKELVRVVADLEKHYGDMQDIEFTVENNTLYFLQTRNGKRTAKAEVKIAVDMVEEGLIDKDQALLAVKPSSINNLLHPTFSEQALKEAEVISDIGLPASPGAATGAIVFNHQSASELVHQGQNVVLVRNETSPDDITSMSISEAIVTVHGGMTSHAAVVARGMGTCCVVGCHEISINEAEGTLTYPGGVLQEGDIISVDGTSGTLYLGEIETVVAEDDQNLKTLLEWARKRSKLSVRMNAETETDIKAGFNFHTDGIGLVRTEHMFFGEERLIEMRRFILADDELIREQALEKIGHFQLEDYQKIFELAKEHPVVVRLLDPPLHEFLPSSQKDIEKVAEQLGETPQFVQKQVNELAELNPMLGHRGVRLAITYPTLYPMQAASIVKGAIEAEKVTGHKVEVEIMIPLASTVEELEIVKHHIEERVEQVLKENNSDVKYRIGTMIETPRACLIADQIAEESEFISFGTNDLSQLAYGFSRDDAGKFINDYLSQGILPHDPFQSVDQEGVGELLKIAVERGRKNKANMKMGVCGEVGGDPKSIEYFYQIGMDYVSCSPYRVPIAQLAAAQATIKY